MSDEIHFEQHGRMGLVILDRPNVLNALTHDMVRPLSNKLREWRDDPKIAMVLVKAVPGRAFCAGGDIAHIIAQVRDHGVAAVLPFFRDEYRLNWRIKTFPKPYVALIDGITMGGGVGISVHGRYRIATERTKFAMPESAIGFFPDVGGSYFLPRLPHQLGRYLALTGQSLVGANTQLAGVATHSASTESLEQLEASLARSGDPVEELLEPFLPAHDHAGFDELAANTEQFFSGDSLVDVQAKLQRSGTSFAQDCLKAMAIRSPLSLKVVFAQLDRGGGFDFEGCMKMEYRIVSRALAWPDFAEGVRALIVDKDRNPNWQYSSIDDVPDEEVDAVFDQIDGGDLSFDWHAD